jgi:hypothetical protein
MLTVAVLSSTNRVIMETDPNAHHAPIGPFSTSGIWSVQQPRRDGELTSGYALSYSTLRELAADGIRDRCQ